MDAKNRENIEAGDGKSKYKLLLALLLSGVLLTASVNVLHAQNAPAPPAPAQASPEPPEPPEPPEIPDQLYIINDGSAHLGVALTDINSEKARELKLPSVGGALVESVQKDSAASKAGIEEGDVIVEFDGDRVRSSAELRRLLRETPSGRTVAMKVIRDGKSHNLTAELKASSNFHMPEVQIPPMRFDMPRLVVPPMRYEGFPRYPGSPDAHRAMLGIAGDDLSPQLAQYFGVKQGAGVLVSEVTKGGPADHAGLKAGDVIVQVDGKPVRGVEELRGALNENFNGESRKVSLGIVREHHDLNINVDLVRFRPEERHTSANTSPDPGLNVAKLKAEAEQLRAHANEVRREVERERTQVHFEVVRQNEFLNNEWQQQMRQEMLTLHKELQNVKKFYFALNQVGEI